MRMRVTHLASGGNRHTITFEPIERVDADGITLVDVHCGDEFATACRVNDVCEVFISRSPYNPTGGGNGYD
jgi:hypothetical protein